MSDSGLYIATDSALTRVDGADVVIQAGQIARAGHPLLETHGHLFEPLTVDYDVAEPEAKPRTARPAAVKNKEA